MKNESKQIFLWIFVLIVLTLPLIIPYFREGFFPTHDGEWAVVRLADMYREIKDGQFPPRFSGNLNFGYGYPLFNFAYPMPYYLGLIFFLSNIGLVNSIKILFALSVPLSAIMMFFASKALWGGSFAGAISALLYAYLPYRMVDLYVRGSLGESLASILFPTIFYLVTVLSSRRSIFLVIGLAVAMGMLILTHNIMAVLFSIIIISYLIFLFFTCKIKNWIQILFGLLGGVFLSAFFWLPALVEKKYVLLSQVPIADRDLYYVTFEKLLFSPWGYGTPTESNPFTYQLGLPQIVLSIISLFLILIKKQDNKRFLGLFLGGTIFVAIFMLFPLSSSIWENTPLLSEINYPWTLLLPIGFLMSLLSGVSMNYGRVVKLLSKLLIFFAIVIVLPFAKPSEYVNKGDSYYFTNDATTTSSQEFMPLWVKQMPFARPKEKIEIIRGNGTIRNINATSDEVTFTAYFSETSTVRLNTIFFPNWRWYEGNKQIPFTYDNPQGVMEATLGKGEHAVKVVFENTIVRTFANLLSGITFLVFLGIFIFTLRKRVKKLYE